MAPTTPSSPDAHDVVNVPDGDDMVLPPSVEV